MILGCSRIQASAEAHQPSNGPPGLFPRRCPTASPPSSSAWPRNPGALKAGGKMCLKVCCTPYVVSIRLRVSYTLYAVSKGVFYTLSMRSPAFNLVQMAWVAGLGRTAPHRRRLASPRRPRAVSSKRSKAVGSASVCISKKGNASHVMAQPYGCVEW